MIALVITAALSQVPLTSNDGFESKAPLYYGSGAPDIKCGYNQWYCLIETQKDSFYSGGHGDVSIQNITPRYAGILFGIQNKAFGSGAIIFDVDWQGNVFSNGSFYAYGNGGGLRNGGFYAAIMGTGSATVPDVIVGGTVAHYNGRANFGVWTGSSWTFRVFDDGAVSFDGAEKLHFGTSDEGLVVTQDLGNGVSRHAVIPWIQP